MLEHHDALARQNGGRSFEDTGQAALSSPYGGSQEHDVERAAFAARTDGVERVFDAGGMIA